MPTSKADSSVVVQLERLEMVEQDIWVVGTAPLIMHKWSEKAKWGLPGHPDAPTSERMRKKGKHEPEKEATTGTYYLPDGRVGFPANGFKASIVGSYDLFSGITKTSLKRLVYVMGELSGSDQLVPIFYQGEPQLREDVARIAKGGTILLYRYQFYPWWAKLTVRYLPTSISAESVLALVDAGGLGGVGEWRPSSPISSTGTFGTYRVMSEEDKGLYGI